MPSAFDAAFAAVIGSEGGYANNPADPGGETCFGISKRSYPDLDIAHLTQDDAKALYRRDFWAKVQGDALPPPLALIVFDAACNNGPARAAKWLQLAVGVEQDGIIGPATLAALAKKSTVGVMIEFNAQRMRFMFMLPTANTFGLGWARRLAALPFAAMGLDEPEPAPPPPIPKPVISQAELDAIEVIVRKVLEDHAYTAALNQRVQGAPVP